MMKKWLSMLLIVALFIGFAAPLGQQVNAATEETVETAAEESLPAEEAAAPEETLVSDSTDGNESSEQVVIRGEDIFEVVVVSENEITGAHTDKKKLDANGIPAIKSTPEEKWIDRLDDPPAYVRKLYNWLIENSDGDGVEDALIEPTTAEFLFDQYYGYHLVTLENLTASYTYGGSTTLEAAGDAQIEKQKAAMRGYYLAAYTAFDRDHTEVFWLSGGASYIAWATDVKYTDKGNGAGVVTYDMRFYFLVQYSGFDVRAAEYQSASTIYATIKKRDNWINTLAAQATGSRYEQLRYLNQWLTMHNSYNTSADLNTIGRDCRNCIGALDGRYGKVGPVCEGYARALKVVCDKLGIPCVLVDGDAINSSGNAGPHMWNYVRMEDGKWYGVDVTWNDPGVWGDYTYVSGYENENYLLVGSDTKNGSRTFIQSHPVENNAYTGCTNFTNGPVLSTTKYDPSQAPVVTEFSIITQPRSVVAKPGETVVFSVVAGGTGLTYQWKYKNATATSWSNTTLAGAKTDTLTVSNLDGKNHNGRQYKCVITDANGAVLETAVVTIGVSYFISNAKSLTAEAGTNAVFSVDYSIKEGTAYQWQFKRPNESAWANTGNPGNKTDTLTVTAKESLNGYKYRCVVTDPNFAEPIYSKEATLTVETLTFGITSQPRSLISTPGATVTFTVKATGQGLTYRWKYRNAGVTTWSNTSLSGYNTPTLTVANLVGATHNGRQYMCVVTDGAGNVLDSEPATLTVAYLINDAKSQSTKIGSNAVFTVNYSVTEGVTYQWQYKGNTASSTWANTSLTGNKTNKLTVAGKTTNNRYMYRCKITDSVMGTFYSKEVYLNIVEDVARITTNPVNNSGVCGAYVDFSVEAVGNGINYQWQWSGDGGATWANTKSKGYNTATLSVKTNNFNDGYMYRCVVKTMNGSGWKNVTSSAAQLTVKPAAEITQQPRNVTANAGESATFHVDAEGEGLTYQWQWAKYVGNWKNTSYSGCNTDTLTIPNVNKDMNGRYYRVIITNRYTGTVTTSYAQLFVQ